jgi:two-component system, response regulator, stage 0 sporulation protein A
MQDREGYHSLEKIKVFIADHDIALVREMVAILNTQRDMKVIGTVNDGRSCLQSAILPMADVLILDDVLPAIDGLSLLNMLQLEAQQPPLVILLTSFYNSYVEEEAKNIGVSVVREKPIAPHRLIHDIRDLSFTGDTESDQSCNNIIKRCLETYGIPSHLAGYQYLCETLTILSNNKHLLHNIKTNVFPPISDKYNTSTLSIERRIDYAIKTAWEQQHQQRNPMTLAFGSDHPTVKNFIAFVMNTYNE